MSILIRLLLLFATDAVLIILEECGIIVVSRGIGGWCDVLTVTDKYAKLKFVIALGMFEEYGAGYELSITDISKNTSVLDPHEFEVVAKSCYSIKFDGDKPPVKSIEEMKFTIKADSYSVRSILKATKEGLKTLTRTEYEIT